MPVSVPTELTPILEAADCDQQAIDELALSARLLGAIPPERELSDDERKGVFAEIFAWRFQRARPDERRTWSIYWNELASWTTSEGRQIYSPDIADVDDDVVEHCIRRSESSTHPTIRARFSDLAWEIGHHRKVGGRIAQQVAHRAIDEYVRAVTLGLHSDEIDAWLWLDRASELASTVKDETRFLAARRAAFSLWNSLRSAMQGRRSSQWAPYYLRLRERGMSSTAALVALSRKLAKVSFALLRTDTRFVPAVSEIACASP